MPCKDCDGRFNCPENISSACVGYTGKISTLVKDLIPCTPNVNDIVEELYKLVEKIKKSLGDNRMLEKGCFSFNNLIVTQEEINRLLLNKLCELQAAIAAIGSTITIDAVNVVMTVNLSCIESGLCVPQVQYTLAEIILKMVTKICDHETRILAIETFLGL